MKGWERFATTNLNNEYKVFISVHKFVDGISLGGTRFMEYNDESSAKSDVLMLSKAMTYKARAAGIKPGGGKAVIMGKVPTNILKKQRILKLFAEFLNDFNDSKNSGGVFKTGADVGIYPKDVVYMKKFTKYVHGFPKEQGGIGDMGLATAKGIVKGVEYLAEKILNKQISECSVGIQGAGQVGFEICKSLLKKGCNVKVNDLVKRKEKKALKIGARLTKKPWDEEIFIPCAIGGIINEKIAETCKAKIICGAANNQLFNNNAGRILHKRKIFYAPDYTVNIGGLVLVYYEDLEKDFNEAEEYICNKVINNLKIFLHSWPKERPELIAKKLFEK